MSTMQDTSPTGVELEAPPAKVRPNPTLRGPVLLATDGTGQSGAPVIAARLVAERLGVPLEVVSVLDSQVMYGPALGGVPIYLPEVDDAKRAQRTAAVLDHVARFSGTAPPPTVHLRFGGIAEAVAQVARERSATLIVVGAAPHHRVTRVIAGERAVHVLRASTVPVLSVPPGFSALPRNIVVAVDFAPASIRAAETALLLIADGGTLTLLHVLSPLLSDAPIRNLAGRDPATAVQTLFGRLRDELRPYVPEDVTIETRVRTDSATDGILTTASSVDADLIAVGTHGPRLLERLFLGSVASSVVHAAPQAVLAVPPPPAAEALDLWRRIAGTAGSDQPREWGKALDDFTSRNAGRRVTIEIDDPQIGAQMLGRGSLAGVTYDAHDKRVEVMVGDPQQTRHHLMHSIPNVESIAMTTDERGASEVLQLSHGHGHTLILIAP
jgi:nucleotide-binding universal stress UspA family protein